MDFQQANISQQDELDMINSKIPLMKAYFNEMGYPPDSLVSEKLWFFGDIGQDSRHILWSVLSSCRNSSVFGQVSTYMIHLLKDDSNPTYVSAFIIELARSIGLLHLEILSRQITLDYLTNNQEQLTSAKKYLDQSLIQENALMVSLVENAESLTDILKFYDLQYRTGSVHQNFQPIYGEDNTRVCSLSLDPLDKWIFINIQGIRLDKKDEDPVQLAQIELPIHEIYQSIRPRHYSLPTIPPTYLKIPFVDQTSDAPVRVKLEVELRFDLKSDPIRRQQIMDYLNSDNSQLIQGVEETIMVRMNMMEQLLSPFDPKIQVNLQYVRARGLGQPKDFPPLPKKEQDPDKPKSREDCCVLF